MAWHETISQGLPPNRDDEPGSLRSDIADELADHLLCARRRELQRTGDETDAERAVLDRFGNPGGVARRLWLFHMKERIMKDRVMIVTMALLVVLCGSMAVMTWSAMKGAGEVNAAVLAKLDQLGSGGARAMATPEWTSLTVALVDERGEPITDDGFRVTVAGNALRPEEAVSLTDPLDEGGRVTYDLVRTGKYGVFVYAPWADTSYHRLVVARPGKPYELTVKCPTGPVEPTPVRVSVDWPDDLRGKGLAIEAEMVVDHKGSAPALYAPGWRSAPYSRRRVTLAADGPGAGDAQPFRPGRWVVGHLSVVVNDPAGAAIHSLASWDYPLSDEGRGYGFARSGYVRAFDYPLATVVSGTEEARWAIELTPAMWDRVRAALAALE